MADIDGRHARDIIAPLLFNDNTELHNLIRKRLILPYLTGSFHPSFIEEYACVCCKIRCLRADFWWLYRNRMEAFAPSSEERYGAAVSQVSQWTRRLSAMRRLRFLLLLMITLFKEQVFEMVPHIARRSSRFFMTTLIHPEVIIKIVISHAFNTTCRALTLDVVSGRASRD